MRVVQLQVRGLREGRSPFGATIKFENHWMTLGCKKRAYQTLYETGCLMHDAKSRNSCFSCKGSTDTPFSPSEVYKEVVLVPSLFISFSLNLHPYVAEFPPYRNYFNSSISQDSRHESQDTGKSLEIRQCNSDTVSKIRECSVRPFRPARAKARLLGV
jgi:hypothetical protein